MANGWYVVTSIRLPCQDKIVPLKAGMCCQPFLQKVVHVLLNVKLVMIADWVRGVRKSYPNGLIDPQYICELCPRVRVCMESNY